MNDADVLRLATTRYQDDGNQGKVPIDLWGILSRSPKWQQLNNPDGGSLRKRSTVAAEVEVDETIGSTDQIPPFNVADSDDEDPIPLPIGRKKAKSIASGSGGSASVFASPRDEIGRAMIEQLRAFNLQEQERLKLKEKELKLKKQEAEMKVMQTDPGTYAPPLAATGRRGHPSSAAASSRKPQQGDRMILPESCADDFAAAAAAATDDSSKLKRIMHREIERQRRQEMATLYASLRSLLPLEYVKGKRSTSDHMHEALNYIKQMQKNVQDLGRKRERLKTAAAAAAIRSPCRGSEKKGGSSSADKTRAAGNFVSVSGCRNGVEVLINCDAGGGGGERGGFALSRVVGTLQKEGVDVVSCGSTRADNRLLHCLQSQVSYEEKGIDLQALQKKLNDVINL
ncbi:unnamed protein product [Cuscuta campestris]|uniref:BHLH domain-containing protein n=1 Tax=Cuscuta campestris TaxID=132261 RepID=A0A484LMN8_9ASTE|nr:unnamed protein product [Cuscuta campestris]